MKKISLFLFAGFALFACKLDNYDLFEEIFNQIPTQNSGIIGNLGIVDKSIATTEPKVSRAVYSDKVELTWDAVEGIDGYVIYFKKAITLKDKLGRIIGFDYDENAEYEELVRLKADADAYFDTKLAFNEAYYYCIKAYKTVEDQIYEGLPSYSYIGWRLAPPAKVEASFKISKEYIKIGWDHVPYATKYSVQRSKISEDFFEEIGETVLPGFIDSVKLDNPPTAEDDEDRYIYRIAAITKYGKTTYSKKSNEGSLIPPGAINPPEEVFATRAEYADSVLVTWPDLAGATGYYIRRTDSDGKNAIVSKDLVKISEFRDEAGTGVEFEPAHSFVEGKKYLYTISAVNSFGDIGGYSENIEVASYPTPDADNCLYTNEGYSLAAPRGLAVKYVSDTVANITWLKSEGADSYILYRKNGDDREVIASDITGTSYQYDQFDPYARILFSAQAIKNIDESTVIESNISADIELLLPPVFTASEGLYEGTGAAMKGYIDVEYSDQFNFVDGYTYKLYRKAPLGNYVELTGFTGQKTFKDANMAALNYANFETLLPSVSLAGSSDEYEALKKTLSYTYKLEVKKNGDSSFVTQSIETSGWKMLDFKELFFMLKVCDHSATNKITNQISAIFSISGNGGSLAGNTFPNKKETDQGYRSGVVMFDPYKAPSLGQQWAELSFEFNNYSDYYGTRMNGKSYVWQNQTLNFLNKDGINGNINITIFDNINFMINEKIEIDKVSNVPKGGNIFMTLKIGGTTLEHTIAQSTGIYSEYTNTLRVPGGRNYTRDGAASSGHYTKGPAGDPGAHVDPVNSSFNARLQSKGSTGALATP